ncbi:arsenate reductase (glutaredoxin) [Ensifer soli]|uniref:arsenate reductase (glutaredoxin) n=1 Tax=Ciceribacter sp. sgz301302 TaxID=3342379 RepID=UPI0035BB217F
MAVTIYYDARSATCRKVLKLIRETGVDPTVIEYEKTPPGREELVALILALDALPRTLLRKKEKLYHDLGLDDESLSDRELIDAMLENPSLIERPIVIGPKGIRLCRPRERVFEIL